MSYEAIITREDGNWLADVPSVPGAHTYARSLPSLFQSIREVIVLMDDLDDDAEPEVTYRFKMVGELVEKAARLGVARAEIAAETPGTIAALSKAGYSVRDIGALVGVTPGRVSQVAKERVS